MYESVASSLSHLSYYFGGIFLFSSSLLWYVDTSEKNIEKLGLENESKKWNQQIIKT